MTVVLCSLSLLLPRAHAAWFDLASPSEALQGPVVQ